ncbi:hypothetical protein AX14_008544 [Amanita brunnescens Koide BX004]|nr:hypothetical protein AX14_008544 [Amanita brunnescens Koide BX004]
MANTAVPATISGFTVLPVQYPSSSASIHYLYTRRHSGPKATKSPKDSKDAKDAKSANKTHLPEGRTLFVVNMPPDATEREVVLFFKFCGTVERVAFDFMSGSEAQGGDSESESENEEGFGADGEAEGADGNGRGAQPKRKRRRKTQKDEEAPPTVVPLPMQNIRKLRKTGRTAHVVFLDASSLERLFSATHSKPRPWLTSEEPLGLAHYIAQYAALRPPLEAVKEHADSYIRVYDYELEKTKQKSKYRKGEAVVDEDGFTLVVRGGAYGRTLGGGVAVASKKFQQTGVANEKSARKRRKAAEDKDGFYAFQKAEKQRSALIELKKKWEEDKAKIEKLKVSRRFRPY